MIFSPGGGNQEKRRLTLADLKTYCPLSIAYAYSFYFFLLHPLTITNQVVVQLGYHNPNLVRQMEGDVSNEVSRMRMYIYICIFVNVCEHMQLSCILVYFDLLKLIKPFQTH